MIKNVKVIKWCISCRNCENICPSIFKVDPKSEVISHDYKWKDAEILQAEAMCPVNVIKVESDWKLKLSFKKAKLIEKNYLTPDTLELKFETNNFKFKPWQYISLQETDLIWSFSRSYSIASWDKNSFTLNVKLEKKWRWSTFFKKLKIWKQIKFLWALWHFYLKNTLNKKVFIATGTGLAPMIAMLEACNPEIEKTVIFWVRYEKDIYYKKKLEKFQNTKVIIKVSKPSENYKWEVWRVTDNLDEIWKNDEVYICWNPEMVESVKNKLEENWHKKELINNESFTISRVYPWKLKDIFFDWNIPCLNILSWLVILFSLIIIPATRYHNAINRNLYWDYFFLSNYMWFMFDLSWWSVVFVMAIRPLADLFPKIWLFRKLVTLRKAFWILSASIIVTNILWWFVINPSRMMNYFTIANFSLYMPISYKLSELTALILLITSNNFSQKILWIWWKRIQRISYIYFITWWIAAALYFPMKIYPAMIIVILLWILAQTKIKIWK